MNVEFQKVDDVHGIITVTVGQADYADTVKKELKNIGKTHAEPGFRAGHVPAGVLEKKYGKSVKYDVVSKLVGQELYKYIEDNHLAVLGQPIPFKENDLNPNETDFTLKFNVGLAPVMDIKADKEMHIPYYKIKISDEMIDEQDKQLRRRFGKQEPGETVDETALVKGVLRELDADGNDEGGLVIENGIVAPQYFKDRAQADLFMGKHVGDKVVFNPWATCDGNPSEMSSMLNIDKKDVENYKGDFEMDIKEIIVLKPAELGEEYYKEVFGADGTVKDEASYRAAVKVMIENSLSGEENFRFTIDARNVIMDKVKDTKLPDDILKEYLIINNKDINESNVDEVYESSKGSLLWDLAKDTLMTQMGIEMTEEDVKQTAKMMARQQFAQYGMANPPEEAIDRFADDILKDKKAIDRIRQNTVDMKFFTALREAVTVDEKEVTPEEFNALYKNEQEEEGAE